MTPYYDDGKAVIYHGDCLEVMGALDPLADIVVTSPPYNMGLTPGGNGRGLYGHRTQKGARFTNDGYDGVDDATPWADYCAWQRRCLDRMFRAAKHAVFYNHRPRVMHGQLVEPLAGDFGHDRYNGLDLRQVIIWDRGTGIDVSLKHFCTRQEWIYLFAWDTFRLVNHAASGMGDVWRLGVSYDPATGDHPAAFPLSLPARCIAASGATSVLDPFMGSGTTLRAASDAGIRSLGIEKSERYCEIAARRLAQGALDFGGAA